MSVSAERGVVESADEIAGELLKQPDARELQVRDLIVTVALVLWTSFAQCVVLISVFRVRLRLKSSLRHRQAIRHIGHFNWRLINGLYEYC